MKQKQPLLKSLWSYFSCAAILKNATDAQKEAVSRKQSMNSYRNLHIVAAVFIFVQLFFIIGDLFSNFYALPYTHINLTAELLLLISSLSVLLLIRLVKDRTDGIIGVLQFVYYLLLETGILLYFISDLLRGIDNISNSFYNMVLLTVFAVYAFRFVVILGAYMFGGALTLFLVIPETFVWANCQLLILLSILFFACANYFRTNNTRFFFSEVKMEQSSEVLKEASRKDFLTRLSNRTALHACINHEILDAIRAGKTVSLMMLDIDDFKCYNDFHSHMNGDLCLARIGTFLLGLENEQFRSFRYGGEEFLVVGLGADEQALRSYAVEILEGVRGLKIRREDQLSDYVTVSIGCAAARLPDAAAFSELLERADKELYIAKRSGKNCCCYAGELIRSD